MSLLLAGTSVCYLAAFAIVLRSLRPSPTASAGSGRQASTSHLPANGKSLLILFSLLAAAGHGALLGFESITGNAINIALGHVISLVCLFSVVAYLAGLLRRDIATLGILVLPIGLIGLHTGYFLSGPELLLQSPPLSLAMHLLIASLAFATLCVATAQAALLYIQEQQLHDRNTGGLLPALPPLQTMETNLLQLLQLGVILLTLNLATGLLSNLQIHGRLIEFNHHILLSFIAWVAYSGLLIGHKVVGWRGKIAARWTILAFIVLVLAYFGARFVSSIILA